MKERSVLCSEADGVGKGGKDRKASDEGTFKPGPVLTTQNVVSRLAAVW